MAGLSERLYRLKNDVLRVPYYAYLAGWFSATSRRPLGTNVYERDWDVLVVLDTCRVDALAEVVPEFDFLGDADLDSIVSVGSGSQEWIANTFVERYRADVENTVLVTANGYSKLMLERGEEFPTDRLPFHLADWQTLTADHLQRHHDVWENSPDPLRDGYMNPQIPTDRAISAKRNLDPDRLIVHYNRPHDPYGNRAVQEGRDLYAHERSPFEALERGEVSREEVWEQYLDELRVGLRQVETILSSVDGRVVVSADHGEAFGEWGVYRHPFLPHPHLRRVPWVELDASDTGEYDPEYPLDDAEQYATGSDREDLEERLQHLGYV